MVFQRLLFSLLFSLLLVSQSVGQDGYRVLSGRVLNSDNLPLEQVNVSLKSTQTGTYTDKDGRFMLKVPVGKAVVLIFSNINFEPVEMQVKPNSSADIFLKLKPVSQQISEVLIAEQRKSVRGTVQIDPLVTRNLADPGGSSVEQLIKTLPGVTSRNELSPQYNVRGGNYDENLIYVNGIEIYRPFLVKTGEQEGLSFVNPELVSAIRFSSGGFESSYGDKMSSVLDIDYKTPAGTIATAEAGALGASAHLEGSGLKGKFTHLSGVRYRDNRYLLGTLDQKGRYSPSFFDFQTLLGYDFSSKFSVKLMANIATNDYSFVPETRETKYGTMTQAYRLKIYFEGNEKDRFENRFGAATLNFNPSGKLKLQLTASSFYSNERERYDILGQYYLNSVIGGGTKEENSDSTMLLGVGSSLVHSGNYLESTIRNLEHRGSLKIANHFMQWGVKYQQENIYNRVNEWEMRDSAGYSLPYNGQKTNLFSSTHADLTMNSQRISGFIQDRYVKSMNRSYLEINGGLRFQYWSFNQQTIVSPRISLFFIPDKNKPAQFHAAWGIYQQMPFFKELKDRNAQLVSNVKAQKSIHYVLGFDYPFLWMDRNFKFSTEIWYKSLSNLIPYKIQNLNLQYFPEEHSKGYATGLEMKLLGEPVPGVTSWASLTLMKTQEDISGDFYLKKTGSGAQTEVVYPGYIPRPTDQRFNFSLFFQDYFPKNPTVKMNLTLLYGSRLPFGPPKSERWMDVFRMPPYRRVDVGLSKMLTGPEKQRKVLRGKMKEAWLSLEIFNLFDLDNTISYYWVSDFENNQHAVPNYLTGRRINLKASVRF